MHSSALVTTSRPRASSSEIARQALVIFGEICGREITHELAAIWAAQLADIAPDLLQQACDRLAKTWTTSFLPTPGNVRAQVDQANANGLHLEIEEAWSHALDWVQRYFHPDLGVARGAPELPAAIQHAMRAAGGLRWIESCPASELQWAKKRFVEDFTRVHETQQSEHLLTRCEAKRIVASFHNPPSLPPANPDWEKKYTTATTPADAPKFKPIRQNVEMTQEEWDARRAFLRAQAEEITERQKP